MKNLIKTTSKEYKERMFKYLLENINFEDVEQELSDKQKIEYFFNEFEGITNYPNNIRKFPAEVDRLADYLQGLPSSTSFAFYNWDILELAKELHQTKVLTEKEQETILNRYWVHIAMMLIRLKTKLAKK